MKSKSFLFYMLIIGLSLMQNTVLYPQESFQQETPEYLQSITKTSDGCEVTHLYATKMYLPVTIKVFHDQTPTFQGTTRSITNNTNSYTSMDGVSSKTAFLFTTNSTDQWLYKVVASYTDSQEHQIYAEYWSQNTQIGIDQFSTTKGSFCRDFLVDTSFAPLQPDIGKSIQAAQAGYFTDMINALLDDHTTLGNLVIVELSYIGFSAVMLIIFLIYMHGGESATRKALKKVILIANNQSITQRNLELTARHISLMEKIRSEKIETFITGQKRFISSFTDQLLIAFRTVLLETKKVEEKDLVEFDKLREKITVDEPVKDVTIEDSIVDEIVKTGDTQTGEIKTTPIEQAKKIRIKFLGKFKKKEEVKIKSIEEWKAFFKEKNLTPKQIISAYSKLQPYVEKNYAKDEDACNKLNALNELYDEVLKK